MTPFWSDVHRDVRRRAEAFAREIEPVDDPRAIVLSLGEAQLCALVAPERFGGPTPSVDVTSLCIVREALAERSVLADSLFAMQGLGSYPITLAGEEPIGRIYVLPSARGEKIAAFALTEPLAGSDVSSIRATARKDRDGYLLDGQKTFISNAGIADYYVVFAKTDESAGARGISAFVVEKDSPGFEVVRPLKLLGDHPIGEISFRDCHVPTSHRLGAEGEGIRIAFATLDLFRATVGAAACGMARRALAEALARVRSRQQFGKALAEMQGVQFALADMATELEAARLLVYRAAAVHDRGEAASRAAAMAKLFATEAAQRIVDMALQLHGGEGLIAGSPTERLYRDVRALRIYEGTSEIQRVVIARDLLREGHAVL